MGGAVVLVVGGVVVVVGGVVVVVDGALDVYRKIVAPAATTRITITTTARVVDIALFPLRIKRGRNVSLYLRVED